MTVDYYVWVYRHVFTSIPFRSVDGYGLELLEARSRREQCVCVKEKN